MIYTGGDSSEAFTSTGLSYLLADVRLKAIIKEWISLRTKPVPVVLIDEEGLRVCDLKHMFQRDTGLYCFNGTMLGCVLEVGHRVDKTSWEVQTNLKLKSSTEQSDSYDEEIEEIEIETVDDKKLYSALKHYTTQFQCDVFKKYFGDGADTESDMIDSWNRLEDLGVKFTGRGSFSSNVTCDVPKKYLSTIPNFIKPWMPATLHNLKTRVSR
ncbi:hypothetical protein NIES4071_105570 (plasmid) [Calothrix sp. NIES-4071]|nr:hypothetical protein NIES4071_105570 [Calothrix sp. NIES-4071]BAZ64975.1 hypothetical protein NIES4105_107080 [Calothrix sp. NIES-4105]